MAIVGHILGVIVRDLNAQPQIPRCTYCYPQPVLHLTQFNKQIFRMLYVLFMRINLIHQFHCF